MHELKYIIITIIIVIILIGGGTFYKAYKNHEARRILVAEKKISEAAMQCYFDDVCTEDSITLGELISLGYVDETVNPVTKMYYSHASYIVKEDNKYTFYEV